MNKKEDSNSSFMTVLTSSTLRGIIRTANEENIKRENVVTLLKDNGQFVLIYYK